MLTRTLCTFAVTLALAAAVKAQVARMEIHPFQSATPTDQEFLTGHEGKTVTIAGELRLPRATTERQPAVILLHGSGGVSGYVVDWEQELNAIGVATFVVDSFTARGIVNTNYDQGQLSQTAMILDAYRALDLLSKHPRLDATRIAVMGFSKGGQAALYSSLNRFRTMHEPKANAFAAYIAFYPACATMFRDEENVADKPIRIFHGTADDYNSIIPCRDYVARLKANGKEVQLIEFAGAGHVFDGRAYRTPVKLEKAQTRRNCRVAEKADGMLVSVKTGQPWSWSDPCVEYGPTLAYDEKASTEARKAVREFVTAVLKP